MLIGATTSDASSFSLIWAILELDMAILCGSFLLMKPVLLSLFGLIWRRLSKSGSHSTPAGETPGDAVEMEHYPEDRTPLALIPNAGYR